MSTQPHRSRHHLAFPFVLAMVAATSVSRAADAPAVGDLRCEHRIDPVGIEAGRPRLSWKLRSSARGARQTAYQVVAADEAGTPLWDSGRVTSERSLLVPYGGKPLRSRQRISWNVRVWDDRGVAIDSAPATFEMGLLARRDWKGSWIGKPTEKQAARFAVDRAALRWIWYPEGDPAVNAPAGERKFRKEFTVPVNAKVQWALLGIAADSSGRVRLNGADVGRIPGIGRLEPFPVSGHVRPGKNVIEVDASNGRDAGGVLAQLRVQLAGDRSVTISSDKSWQASRDGGEWVAAREAARVGQGPFWGHTAAELVAAEDERPSAFLRTRFSVDGPVRRARLYVTALGLYEARLNGERVGADRLTPGWTNYGKRVLYQSYDVTKLVRAGDNVLGAMLGDGWYTGKVGYSGRHIYGGYPLRLLANLVIERADGRVQVVATDKAWRATSSGPILTNDLMDGEAYDARRELPGWDAPGYADAAWSPVDVGAPATAALPVVAADPGVPIRVTEELRPRSITEPKPGVFVLDLGQNISGWVRLRVRGPAGTAITLRFAEMLNADGTPYTANLRNAEATDRYTLRGGGVDEVWEPRFTFHGFRYVELTGWPGKPTADSILGRVVHSDIPRTGAFSSSSELVNRLVQNIDWGQRDNFLSVPTDCPQRDERLGWLGDAQIFARTAVRNRDVAAFFTKWLLDVRDEQTPDGAFPDVAPSPRGMRGGAPGWGDAGVIVPWVLYEETGDTQLLSSQYPAMRRWIAYVGKHNPDGLWRTRRGNDYGDWLSIGANTNKEVLATAFYAQSATLVARAARALGKSADARAMDALATRIREAFVRAYVKPDGRIESDTQTLYALALRYELVPPHLRPLVGKHLAADVQRRKHLTTGFIGVGHLLPALTDAGRLDLAYGLLLADTFPSWGYSIRQGATTIWERWDGWTKEKGFQDPGMNSFNHYSFGSVGEWLYGSVVGIEPALPGYKRIRFAPRPGPGLSTASGEIETPFGKAQSAWKRSGQDVHVHLVVPPNTTAEFVAPGRVAAVPDGAKRAREAPTSVFELVAGTWDFVATP